MVLNKQSRVQDEYLQRPEETTSNEHTTSHRKVMLLRKSPSLMYEAEILVTTSSQSLGYK